MLSSSRPPARTPHTWTLLHEWACPRTFPRHTSPRCFVGCRSPVLPASHPSLVSPPNNSARSQKVLQTPHLSSLKLSWLPRGCVLSLRVDWLFDIVRMQGRDCSSLLFLFFQAAAGGDQPGAPRPTVIQLSQEDRDAVERLMGLTGRSQQEVVQAYLACDKDENAAANLLFDSSF